MDSINKNQREDNRADLSDRAAIEQIRELVEAAKSCFFCTQPAGSPSNGTRPMSVQRVDDSGSIWFVSANDSYKNAELERDSSVELYFQGSPHSDFLHLRGTASVTTDRAVIDERLEPLAKVWFTDG